MLVDRHTLTKSMSKMSAYQKDTFEAILCGGFRSATQFCKAGLVDDPTCPFCGQTEETVEHISCIAQLGRTYDYPSQMLISHGY